MDRESLDFSYYFRDLTAAKAANMNILQNVFTDKQVQQYNPSRYNFYLQLLQGLMNPSSKSVVDTVLEMYKTNAQREEDMREKKQKIANAFSYLNALADKSSNPAAERKRLLYEVQRKLEGNPITADIKLIGGTLPKTDTESEPESKSKLDQKYLNPKSKYSELLEEIVNQKQEKGLTEREQENILTRYMHDPVISPDNMKITSTDRIIFIAGTFIIRSLSLFIVQWGVNTYMIQDFKKSFLFYVMSYIAIFMLWVLLTNASHEVKVFRLLFFYLCIKPHGLGRIAVHMIIQLLLLPVPFLINDPSSPITPQAEQQTALTIEQRQDIIGTISNFTFLLWILTSIIALNY